MRNRIVAIFFAVFGGVVGMHKIYLNGWRTGRIRLILFILAIILRMPMVIGVLAIVAFAEAIRLATMDPGEFDRRYNTGTETGTDPGQVWQEARRERRRERRAPRPSAIFSGAGKWLKSGTKKFRNYDLKGALADFLQAEKRDPRSSAVQFNLACTYSMLEDAENGFRHLSLAVQNGLADKDRIMTTDSLAFLRIQPGFRDFAANGYRSDEVVKSLGSGQESGNLLDELRRLGELREKGDLSAEEFHERKRNLFG